MFSYLPGGVLDKFVAENLRAETPGAADGEEPTHRVELVPHRNAKAVYEYRYLDHRIIAKAYDNVEDGDSAYRVWHALWTQGFGPGSIHRVPEPLIYLPESRTLLMEPARGTCLLPLVLRDSDACHTGMQVSARWLAELHTSPVRAGPPDNSARILYRLARKLIRAVSRHPELVQTMTALISELGRRGDAFASLGSQPVVQTHGQYHSGHVFVAKDAVTVIDLDRAAPADPAKDVAEFLCRFRIEARKESVKRRLGDNLDTIGVRIFIDEYQRASALRPAGLLYYWSATLLGLMLDSALKRHLDEEIRNSRMLYFETEFAELPQFVADLGQPT